LFAEECDPGAPFAAGKGTAAAMAFWPREGRKVLAAPCSAWNDIAYGGRTGYRNCWTWWGRNVTRMWRAALVGMLLMLLAGPAAAWDTEVERASGWIYDVKIGAQVHDVPYMWSGFNKEPYSVDLNLEVSFSPLFSVWGWSLRPAIGATINFAGYTSKAYIDARWQREFAYNTFFALGLGVAIHNGNDESFVFDPNNKLLGRRVLFHPHLEWGYRMSEHTSLSIFFEHISNADTAVKNQGLDTIGIRYGYRF
jgi:lipid A 3-O-deacylase